MPTTRIRANCALCAPEATDKKGPLENEQRNRSDRPGNFSRRAIAIVTTCCSVSGCMTAPVDIDGLRRFHRQLQRGRLSRRIERSPLPFGRHRWVSPGDQPDIEIVSTPRPREEFDAWLDEQATTPLDSEHGPGWHLAVLPFTDGGAGVSLLISHCLTDGVGLCEAVADAARGRDDAISWPAAGSRARWRAVCEDARQTAARHPAIGRAVAAAARFAREAAVPDRSRHHLPCPPPARRTHHCPNGNDLRRRRRMGRPRTLTRGDQQRAARGIGGPPRPASGTWRS